MIALLAILLVCPHHHRHPTATHAALRVAAISAPAAAETLESSWSAGAAISRDSKDGPTLFGGELLGRKEELGLRMSFSGGDRVTRMSADALYFPELYKAVEPYLGVGLAVDCITPRATRHHDDPPSHKNDPPSLILGLQGSGKTALFGEGRWTFGDSDHGTAAVGVRQKF